MRWLGPVASQGKVYVAQSRDKLVEFDIATEGELKAIVEIDDAELFYRKINLLNLFGLLVMLADLLLHGVPSLSEFVVLYRSGSVPLHHSILFRTCAPWGTVACMKFVRPV
jgi:hypothetical protein